MSSFFHFVIQIFKEFISKKRRMRHASSRSRQTNIQTTWPLALCLHLLYRMWWTGCGRTDMRHDSQTEIKQHALPFNNTVGKYYSAVFHIVDDSSFLWASELLSHIPKKEHCFLACWGINFMRNSIGTPLNSVQVRVCSRSGSYW